MSAVEVPAEPVEYVLERLEYESRRLHDLADASTGHAQRLWEVCDGQPCRRDRENAATLRALLPQPLFTCPNCGHADEDHRALPAGERIGGVGCYFAANVGAAECDCPFTREGLPTVRALLAAERDSKPAPVQPRVWGTTDPNPAIQGVTKLRDSQGYLWNAYGNNWRSGAVDSEYTWAAMQPEWFPFTEVIAAGAR